MYHILENDRIFRVREWAVQCSELIKKCWTGTDGVCYFPYQPLTGCLYWETEVKQQIKDGKLILMALVVSDLRYPLGKICAVAALIDKGDYWEMGRMNACEDAPRGAVTHLCALLIGKAKDMDVPVVCETTQRHTSSQFICNRLGMRFAGIGLLSIINGVWWDILYFDSDLLKQPFNGEPMITGNPLGKEIKISVQNLDRLMIIQEIITLEEKEDFPPQKFHVIREILPNVKNILDVNLKTLGLRQAS